MNYEEFIEQVDAAFDECNEASSDLVLIVDYDGVEHSVAKIEYDGMSKVLITMEDD